MRISDWSSDVCSSDLLNKLEPGKDIRITLLEGSDRILSALPEKMSAAAHKLLVERGVAVQTSVRVAEVRQDALIDSDGRRSEERRVGKECDSTCRSRWSPYP